MKSDFRIRNRLVKDCLVSPGSTIRALTSCSNHSSNRFNRPKKDNIFSKTKTLQKSLESVRIKIKQTQDKNLFFQSKKLKNLQKKIDITKVEIKLQRAAIFIQKHIKGFLTRKKYQPIILQHCKRTLRYKVQVILEEFKLFEKSAIIIQRNFKRYIERKKYLNQLKLKKICEEIFESVLILKIQRQIRKFFEKRKERKKLEERKEIFNEKMRFFRVKEWWDNNKFNLRVIRKHYEAKNDVNLFTVLENGSNMSADVVNLSCKFKNFSNRKKSKNLKNIIRQNIK